MGSGNDVINKTDSTSSASWVSAGNNSVNITDISEVTVAHVDEGGTLVVDTEGATDSIALSNGRSGGISETFDSSQFSDSHSGDLNEVRIESTSSQDTVVGSVSPKAKIKQP